MFSLFSIFTLFSTTGGRITFSFESRGKDLRPLLASSEGAMTLIFFELDFEVVIDAVAVYRRLKAAFKRRNSLILKKELD